MAQLVARLVRNEKVGGSNPPSSTTHRHPIVDVGFSYVRAWYRPGSVCCMAGVGVPVLCAEGELGALNARGPSTWSAVSLFCM